MSRRTTYLVTDVTDAPAVCAAVFQILDVDVETVRIDAYSDYHDQMPDDVRAAEAWLRDRGLRRPDRDPGESISIHRDEDIGWPIAIAYALWSTRITLRDANGSTLATLDDGSRAISVELTEEQHQELQDLVGATSTIAPFASGNR